MRREPLEGGLYTLLFVSSPKPHWLKRKKEKVHFSTIRLNYLIFMLRDKLIRYLENSRHAELCILLSTPIPAGEMYSPVCKLWDKATSFFCYLVCVLVTKGSFSQITIEWTTSDSHRIHASTRPLGVLYRPRKLLYKCIHIYCIYRYV